MAPRSETLLERSTHEEQGAESVSRLRDTVYTVRGRNTALPVLNSFRVNVYSDDKMASKSARDRLSKWGISEDVIKKFEGNTFFSFSFYVDMYIQRKIRIVRIVSVFCSAQTRYSVVVVNTHALVPSECVYVFRAFL